MPAPVRTAADGASNTLFFGERFHSDPAYPAIATLGGWAWANYNAPQDYIFSAAVPVNFTLPPGTTFVRAELLAPDGKSERAAGCDPVVGGAATECRDDLVMEALTSPLFVPANRPAG